MFNHLCREQNLPFYARSAGLYSNEGSPASDGACAAMKERGLSLSRHSAQLLTKALVQESFLIMGMTPEHTVLCRKRFPEAPARSFSPGISDPFGGSVAVYRAVAASLEAQLLTLLDDLTAEYQQ